MVIGWSTYFVGVFCTKYEYIVFFLQLTVDARLGKELVRMDQLLLYSHFLYGTELRQ
jgi:hypothetical protein